MKNLFLILSLIFLISCGNDTDQNSTQNGLIEQNQHKDTTGEVQKLLSMMSDELRATIDSAKKIGYTDTIQINSDENFFGLVDPGTVFANAENDAMQNADHTSSSLIKMDSKTKKPTTWATIDEYIFENETKSKLIEEALGKPLVNKAQERFLRHPLTFFRFRERIYYISTTDEKYRPALDEVNGILVKFLSPEQ